MSSCLERNGYHEYLHSWSFFLWSGLWQICSFSL